MFFVLLDFFFSRSYKSNSLKHNSIYEALVPFFSPCLLFILSTAWILQSPCDILEMHPRVFYFMVGTAFANITVRFFSFKNHNIYKDFMTVDNLRNLIQIRISRY